MKADNDCANEPLFRGFQFRIMSPVPDVVSSVIVFFLPALDLVYAIVQLEVCIRA